MNRAIRTSFCAGMAMLMLASSAGCASGGSEISSDPASAGNETAAVGTSEAVGTGGKSTKTASGSTGKASASASKGSKSSNTTAGTTTRFSEKIGKSTTRKTTQKAGTASTGKPAAKKPVIYDLTATLTKALSLNEADNLRFLCCLQGIVNRNAEKSGRYLHLSMDAGDIFWLQYMTQDGRGFAGYTVEQISTASDFYAIFEDDIRACGLVIWDTDVPATADVAATVCGVDGYLPIRYDAAGHSLYSILTNAHQVPVKMDLRGKFTGKGSIPDTNRTSSGSRKCDAYLWALDRYMPRCGTDVMGYVVDGASMIEGNPMYAVNVGRDVMSNQIYNLDYLVANKAFVFDLCCCGTEAPCDDHTQPVGTDLATLKAILQTAYDRADGGFTRIIGFPPWWEKYTRFQSLGSMGEVEQEWAFVQLASTYNCVLEADCAHPCCMTNASVYCHYPIAAQFTNNHSYSQKTYSPNTRYYTLYVGDYDSAAWLKSAIPTKYKDPARGTFALGWGINPNLSIRIPMVFEYMYENRSELDYFITGDSGAGYVNPAALIQGVGGRTLPTALTRWADFNKPFLQQFDMDICGFVLNGNLPFPNEVYEIYARLFPTGSFTNHSRGVAAYKGVPFTGYTDYTNDSAAYQHLKKNGFSNFRVICQTPTEMKRIVDAIGTYCNSKNDSYHYEYVGPYEYFDLIRQSGKATVIK